MGGATSLGMVVAPPMTRSSGATTSPRLQAAKPRLVGRLFAPLHCCVILLAALLGSCGAGRVHEIGSSIMDSDDSSTASIHFLKGFGCQVAYRCFLASRHLVDAR